MTAAYDAIIVGSGPAGVSASFPLVEAGLRVLMLDAGKERDSHIIPPEERFLDVAFQNTTPKLGIPGMRDNLERFKELNNITTENFLAIGALISGGLSNIWGAGVAVYDDNDLSDWPISYQDLQNSYATVIKRIGVSGSPKNIPSDLSALLQPELRMDSNCQYLMDKFLRSDPVNLDLWPSHNAVITESMDSRLPCNLSGTCFWGCERHSIWNARMDIDKLKKYPNFTYVPGIFVQTLEHKNTGWTCLSRNIATQENVKFEAAKVFLGAGTIGSTRIVLSTFKEFNATLTLQSNPCAVFMLYLPKHFRRKKENAYGMAQLSFSSHGDEKVHGNLFNASLIPSSAYIGASMLPAAITSRILACILPASVAANCFFSGNLSNHTLRISDNDEMTIYGNYHAHSRNVLKKQKILLSQSFKKLGAIMVPTSFRFGEKGGDIHYAASLPMTNNPQHFQTDKNGKLAGYDGLYIIDGSVFTNLPHKPLTLTIMANADRIARIAALNSE